MSQRCAGKCRSAVITAILATVLVLAGCSFAELETFATENDIPEDGSVTSSAAAGKKSIFTLLAPDHIIKGGKQPFTGVAGTFARYVVGADDEILFIEPVAVGGVANYLYIVDARPSSTWAPCCPTRR